MPKPTPLLRLSADRRLPYGPFNAYFDRPTDPDTCVVIADLGFGVYMPVSVRLRGLEARESDQIGADELVEAINRVAKYGTLCEFYTEKTPRSADQKKNFERYVGDVVLPGNRDLATLVNEEIKRLEEKYGRLDPGM